GPGGDGQALLLQGPRGGLQAGAGLFDQGHQPGKGGFHRAAGTALNRLCPGRGGLDMRKHPRPFRKLRGLRPLATFCALGALVFLLAFLGETQPAARQVASIPPGGEVRLFEEQGGLCLLAYSGQAPGTSALYALDTATGETLSNYVSFQGTLVWARQRGSSLFAVEHSAAGYTLHQFALPNFGLEPIHSRLLSGVSEDTFAVFDCDGEGRFFYANGLLMTGSVQDSSLSVVQAGGSMVSGVSFLEVTP